MKFERRFRQHQEPSWAPNYLDYRALKALLKASPARSPQQSIKRENFAKINEEVQRVERFYLDRNESLRENQKHILELHGLNQDYLNSESTPCVNRKEELAASLLEVANDLERLQHFADLNRNALQRILGKLNADQQNSDDDGQSILNLDQIYFIDQTESHWNVKEISKYASNLLQGHVVNKQYDHSKNTAKPSYRSSTEDNSIPGSESLFPAFQHGKPEMVRSLVDQASKLNQSGYHGETLLYTASQSGRVELVEMLLSPDLQSRISADVPENVRGWTPLIVACVEGHLSIVKLLLEGGADPLRCDRFGWSAREHAAYRGHLSVAALLPTPETNTSLPPHRNTSIISTDPTVGDPNLSQDAMWNDSSVGHILVTLGSPNLREHVKAVDLISSHADSPTIIKLLPTWVLEIKAIGPGVLTREGQSIQLPVVEELINQPWHFVSHDLEQVRLVFDIRESAIRHDGRDGEFLGRGVALLKSLRHGLASTREGLARYYTIPIMGKDTLDHMGTVTFGLLLVTPGPKAPNIPASAKRGFWKGDRTQVVGHRGSGANTAARTHLQLGENTIQSFNSAAALGASAVEFDVQLTKDLKPVIYHDFLVMEAGGDNPIYTLRFNQFVHLSEAQQTRGDLSEIAEKRFMQRNKEHNSSPSGAASSRPRAFSLSVYDDSRTTDLMDRMKHTEAAMEGLHKGNLVGDSIHGVFPTFEDLFTKLPKSVAFNVEMKYPMLWEAEDRNMDRYAPEINAYVNIVLSIIYRLGGNRSITFSSFSPEVCILLTLKQRDYPVLFLSKAGSIPVGDIRCSGLQQSIAFAKRWNLAGIVILSDPLVMCPRLIGYAKSAGLKVCSYGPLNNDPESAKIQAKAGLDVIIVDRVRLIAQTLAET